MQKNEAMVTFEALQKSCEKHNPRFLTKTFQVTTQVLGYQLSEGVKKIGFVLLDILGLPIFEAHAISAHMMMPMAPPT